MSHAVWKSVAAIEGGKFQKNLVGLMWAAALGGAVFLTVLASLDIPIKWVIVVAYAQAIFAVGGMLNTIGAKLEERHSYSEQRLIALHDDLSSFSNR